MVSTISITCDIISAGRAERTWSNLDWSSSMPRSRNRDSTKVNPSGRQLDVSLVRLRRIVLWEWNL
jgi:hypothetical protein